MNSILHCFDKPQFMLVKGQLKEVSGFIFNVSSNGGGCSRVPLYGKTLLPGKTVAVEENGEDDILFIAENNGYTHNVRAEQLEVICQHIYKHCGIYSEVLKILRKTEFFKFAGTKNNVLATEDGNLTLTIDGHKVWYHPIKGLEVEEIEDLLEVLVFVGVTLDCIQTDKYQDKPANVLKDMLYNAMQNKMETGRFLNEEVNDDDGYWIHDGKFSYNMDDFENPIEESYEDFRKKRGDYDNIIRKPAPSEAG